MRLLPDHRLYTDGRYCLEWLRSLVRPLDIQLQAHCTGRRFTAKHGLCINSFTRTHPNVSLRLWIDADFDIRPLIGETVVRGDFYDLKRLADDTTLAGHPVLDSSDPQWRADIFKALALYKYGGLYFDLDTLWLRPLSFLFGEIGDTDFAYRWAGEPYCNNAVLYMRPNSPNAAKLIEAITSSGNAIPWNHLRLDNDMDMLALPCGCFDPFWLPHQPILIEDTFRPMTTAERRQIRNDIDGCFCHHWHGRWDDWDTDDSFAYALHK